MNTEKTRLNQNTEAADKWRQWGPYLSERQWGTVREDYSSYGEAWEYVSHDASRSRAYRWGEDGIAGFCDDKALGKPVEIQAMWLNALHYASSFTDEWSALFEKGRASFAAKFWNEEAGYLNDVVDANHEPGKVDASFRPNQIFAAGGLSLQLISDEQTRQVVDQVESRLLAPIGLRSLDREHPDYRAHYGGGVWERDGCYHQGTVWPWLIGPFIQAWLHVRGDSAEAKWEASERFVAPLERHIETAGVGHISEICDAEETFTPRGCPFQAWSYGEYLRIKRQLLKR